MKITLISDLHGAQPKLTGGDLLIVAGDLTARDEYEQYEEFFEWLKKQQYQKKIFISGNHDNQMMSQFDWGDDAEYLLDFGTEFEGLKIWGSPWTKSFMGMNPACKAYTVKSDNDLAKKWALIPADTDILITHSPPYGILDDTYKMKFSGYSKDTERAGSRSLLTYVVDRIKPKIHVFGHIHESYGQVNKFDIKFVNAAIMTRGYEPKNEPINIEL